MLLSTNQNFGYAQLARRKNNKKTSYSCSDSKCPQFIERYLDIFGELWTAKAKTSEIYFSKKNPS